MNADSVVFKSIMSFVGGYLGVCFIMCHFRLFSGVPLSLPRCSSVSFIWSAVCLQFVMHLVQRWRLSLGTSQPYLSPHGISASSSDSAVASSVHMYIPRGFRVRDCRSHTLPSWASAPSRILVSLSSYCISTYDSPYLATVICQQWKKWWSVVKTTHAYSSQAILVVHLAICRVRCPQMQPQRHRCFALPCDFSGQVWLVLVLPACFGGHYGNGRSSIPSKSSLPSPMGPRLTLPFPGDFYLAVSQGSWR